jgi:hypothetical protein
MKTKKLIIISLLFILFLGVAASTHAQTVTVGVTKGSIFSYAYDVTWSSNDPTKSVPSEIQEMSKIDSFKINITEISGSIINTEITTYYKDGTEQTDTGYIDVSAGNIHMDFGFLIARANMNANEKIYPTGGEASINDITQRTYTTGQRETCHRLVETTSENYYEKTEFYYDRALGIAVVYDFESRDTSGGYTTTITEAITNDNADSWGAIPEFPLFAIPVILVAAAAAVLLTVRKQKSQTSPLFFK